MRPQQSVERAESGRHDDHQGKQAEQSEKRDLGRQTTDPVGRPLPDHSLHHVEHPAGYGTGTIHEQEATAIAGYLQRGRLGPSRICAMADIFLRWPDAARRG